MKSKSYLLLLLFILPSFLAAGKKKKLSIEVSSKNFKVTGNDTAFIRCRANKSLLEKNENVLLFHFFAQNDVRDLPMELGDKTVDYIILKKGNDRDIMFTERMAKIFFTTPSDKYYWKWRGRAKAPVSPIVDVAGEKVKKLKCWFILQSGKKSFSSDTVTINIIQ
jgi:hypothetical protein